ncbi:nitroreductase family deazaflavin-dependent oxidoreductase [Streptomyces sp. NPDC006385]|uniref:nitroreductase family deazaflavin-dependent oxidoreductase n=1 Tax=Streptomyces sp. NPDC006385 TaxID=3156761 RepID=UPI0033B4338C
MTHPLLVRLATSRAVLRVAPHVLPRCDLFIHRLTRGRLLPTRLVLDTIVLGTTGHRSGTPRATPLAAHRAADGTWLVVGSNFGRSHHPAWSTNLLHHPHATVTAQGRSWQVSARRLTGHEKEQQRNRILLAVPFYDAYDTYAARAGRDIRVFRLTPITAPPADRPAQA